MALFSVIFFPGVLSCAIRPRLAKVKTGREGLTGRDRGRPDRYRPFRQGLRPRKELRDVMSEEPLRAGERVKVVAVTGMTVKVEKAGGA